MHLYCDRKCAGLARRNYRCDAELKESKRLYDIEYRAKNIDRITAEKKVYFQETYDPEKAAEERAKAKLERPHVEAGRRKYMASPGYRASKKKYDRHYKAVQNYGDEWGPCMALVLDIRDECLNQMSDYEIRHSKGTLSKSQTRKRDYERLNSNKPEIGSLGNIA